MTGGPLIVEDLDLSGIGLYLEEQIDPEHKDDYVLTGTLSLGRPLYKRLSEEGVKWQVFNNKEIV
jgi:hypothetical protein